MKEFVNKCDRNRPRGRRERDPPLGSVDGNAGISCLFSVKLRLKCYRGGKKGSANQTPRAVPSNALPHPTGNTPYPDSVHLTLTQRGS